MTVEARLVEGRVAAPHPRVHVRMGIQQGTHHPRVPSRGRFHKRCARPLSPSHWNQNVRIDSRLEKFAERFRVPLRSSGECTSGCLPPGGVFDKKPSLLHYAQLARRRAGRPRLDGGGGKSAAADRIAPASERAVYPEGGAVEAISCAARCAA